MTALTITQAAKLIAEAVKNGSCTFDEASEMQTAIRSKRTFSGVTMTNQERYNMMVNRFGFFGI